MCGSALSPLFKTQEYKRIRDKTCIITKSKFATVNANYWLLNNIIINVFARTRAKTNLDIKPQHSKMFVWPIYTYFVILLKSLISLNHKADTKPTNKTYIYIAQRTIAHNIITLITLQEISVNRNLFYSGNNINWYNTTMECALCDGIGSGSGSGNGHCT